MGTLKTLSILALISLNCIICNVQCANFNTLEGYYGQLYATISSPRSLLVDDVGDLLVLSINPSIVTSLVETENSNGSVTIDQIVILNGTAESLNLNHALRYKNGFLYASSDTTVYRWPYVPGRRKEIITNTSEIVVSNIPGGFRHQTRAIILDDLGQIYVQVGSADDVDLDSSRSKIKRFNITEIPVGGIDFESQGEVFAEGMRNNVGLAFDKDGVLWGTDNGPGPTSRDDLGGIITDGNPADDLNRFLEPGCHYGFPYCFSSYNLTGFETGTQFAWSTFLENGTHTDEWCRNSSNNLKPQLALPDHGAALGISFLDGRNCRNESEGAFPCLLNGSAVIAFHGSNPTYKITPSGYSVALYLFDENSGMPTGFSQNIIYEPDPKGCPETSQGCFRPVDVAFDRKGRLLVSADTAGEIFRVSYKLPPPTVI